MITIARFMLIGVMALFVLWCFVLVGPWAFLLALPAVNTMLRNRKWLTAYGTARWATERDFDLNAGGLAIGRLSVPRRSLLAIFNPKISSLDACNAFVGKRESPLVRLPNVVHTAVFAPTGVGKGVSFVIPHGLSCDQSTVFVDFKGELAKAVAEYRRTVFGHRIVMLDPFRVVTKNPDTFNPLDFIDGNSSLALDDCRSLAEALVIRTGQERDPHWSDAAEMNIGGIASFVAQYAAGEDRSLQTIRDLLSNPEELQAAIEVMRKSQAWSGMLARLGDQLSHFRDKELSSTLTTTGRFLRFLDTLAIAENTRQSSFDPAGLLSGKMSVFLVLPPEHMRTQSPLLRLWIGSLLRAVVRGGLQDRRKVHFVLDEAASIGKLDCLDDAVDKYRGYGVRIQFFYQSLGQLKKCFPDGQDQTLLSNTTQIFFGTNDLPTAEYISSRCGEGTIKVESGGTSEGRSRQNPDNGTSGSNTYSTNSNANWQQAGRKMLRPEEVLALDARTAITFTPAHPPIRTTLDRYYENKKQSWKWLVHTKMFLRCLMLFTMALIFTLVLLTSTHPHQKGDGNERMVKRPHVRN